MNTLNFSSGKAKRSAGWVLLEVAVGIAIAAIVISAISKIATSFAENRQVTQTEQGIVTLTEALYNFRLNSTPSAWPAALADLSAYAPTLSSGGRNGVGQPYAITPPATLTDPIATITITTDMLTEEMAEKVAREFPNTGSNTGSTVSIEIPVPGQTALLARDGSGDMQGDLDMGDNTITDVDLIDAERLNVGGQDLSTLLPSLAQLNCNANQSITISAGAASCVNNSNGGDLPNPWLSPCPDAGCDGSESERCRRDPSTGSCTCWCESDK